MASEQAQPEGSYPRVNSSMLETNKYDQMIVSLVGIFQKSSGANMDFLCSDNKVVQLNCEQMEIPPGVTEELTMMVDQNNATKYEVIGLVNGPNSVTVRIDCLLLRSERA